MKVRGIALLVSTIVVGVSVSVANEASQGQNDSIRAFVEICVRNAPTFAGAGTVAVKFGITEFIESGEMKIGATEDSKLSVQIKEGKECVVATDKQAEKKLTQQFLDAIAAELGTPAGKRVPAKLAVGGKQFIFKHDRHDGETFVMLSTER
jgi:hypothetical protein